MPIDTSIYGNIQPVQIESPINKLAQIAQLQGAQRQNQLAEMQMATARRAEAGENALNSAYQGATGSDGTIDRNKLYSGVAQSGQGSKLPGIQKGFSDMDKSAQEATLAQINTHLKTLDVVSQSLGPTLQNPALYPQVKAALAAQYPEGAANLPDQFDPSAIQAVINKALTAKDQIAIKQKELDQSLARDKFSYDQKNDAANRGVTIRGQNMTDSRAREATAQGRIPAGYRANPDGTLSAIPGGPADASTGAGAKPTADYLKQAEAYQNMDDAITGYTGILKNFGLVDAANPTKRAELDSAYQNALLQAKEIYKLGVLNGGDERIIKGVINRPLDLSSAFVPKEALIKQATDLQGIIKRGNENLAKVNKQKVVPLNSESASQGAPNVNAGDTMKVSNAADYAKVPSGAVYVTPDGQTRKKP